MMTRPIASTKSPGKRQRGGPIAPELAALLALAAVAAMLLMGVV